LMYSTERDIPWSITVIVVMSRRVMGITNFNSCRSSGGNKTPGVNLVIKCVVLQSDKMYRWNYVFISPIIFFQVLSQIPLRIKKKTFLFLSSKRKTSLNIIPGMKSRDRENSTRTESSFELMNKM
jgi:hypothetical protein